MNNKSNLNDFQLYINIISSYSFRVCKNDNHHVNAWKESSLFVITKVSIHSRCEWLNYTMEIDKHIVLRYSNGYNHSSAPKHGIWVNIASFVYTIQNPICYVGCLMIANICTYISLYNMNMATSVNKKLVCIPTSTCEHLWPSPCKVIAIPHGQLRIHITSF